MSSFSDGRTGQDEPVLTSGGDGRGRGVIDDIDCTRGNYIHLVI